MREKKVDVVACVMAFIPRGGGGVQLLLQLPELSADGVCPQISKFTFITLII